MKINLYLTSLNNYVIIYYRGGGVMKDISINDIQFFVDKKTSKTGNNYCAFYARINDKPILICFISEALYNVLSK